MPRFSESTKPASLSFAMWCEMVGWLSPRPAVESQMQIGASAFHSDASMVRRVGSASVFISSEVSFAQRSFTTGSSQHAPRCLCPGNVEGRVIAMRQSYETHRHLSMDPLESIHRSSSIKGAPNHE